VFFALKAVNYAMSNYVDFVVVGHICQVPVAWALKKLGLVRSYSLVLHGIEAWRKAAWFDYPAARGAGCVVATTHFTAREFSRLNGIDPERFRVIPISIAVEKIEVPAVSRGRAGEIRLLTVARLTASDKDKGVDTLINAVAKGRDNSVKVHLTVVGDGDDRQRLIHIAANMNLDSQTIFLGTVSNKRLEQLYRGCDVFAMPSKKEGFGIVFLEATRFGKPCIAGNHGGIPEVVTHGVDGYLVDYGDVGQIAKYLIELVQKPELGHAMGLRG